MDANAIMVRTRPVLTTFFDKNKFTDGILNEVKLLASQFIGLSQGEIAKIFANKFCLINFYKLRDIQRCDNMY